MINPVLVETVRGGTIDLRHRGAIAVSDGGGRLVWSTGDVDRPIFPRSAVKLFQALPLVESGAADRYGLTDQQLAFACSSHSSEEGHVEMAGSMLALCGLAESDLECGAHWPLYDEGQLIEFARQGRVPNRLHNNCSGKHAGFLCAACHQEMGTSGYVKAEHQIQRQVKAAQVEMTGYVPGEGEGAIDGCSIPAYAFPLRALAHGFAKVATGHHLGPERAKAARRLMETCIANPWFTAGTNRFCTRLMEAGEGEIYAKIGADGVYVAALPGAGLGVALKCDDGSAVAAEIMIASVVSRLLGPDDELCGRIEPLAHKALRDRNGIEVGEIRPVSA